jgi:hypothetical protein
LDVAKADRSRVAVVFGSGFGCIDLTASFYSSAAKNGWSGTDPILFPETLANAPAAHVALFHGLRGPNISIGSKLFSGEVALLHGASLLRHGQADLAIVLAGDVLTRGVYEWYETAQILGPGCFDSGPVSSGFGFIPAEGVVAMLLQPVGPTDRCYARVGSGTWRRSGDPCSDVRAMHPHTPPDLVICTRTGAPCGETSLASCLRAIAGDRTTIYSPHAVASGLADAGGLFHLMLALGAHPRGNSLLLGASKSGCAAVRLELP